MLMELGDVPGRIQACSVLSVALRRNFPAEPPSYLQLSKERNPEISEQPSVSFPTYIQEHDTPTRELSLEAWRKMVPNSDYVEEAEVFLVRSFSTCHGQK